MANHIEQLRTIPQIVVTVARRHAHISDGHQKFAVFRVDDNLNFAGWGWVAIVNGRTDVYDWDEFLSALAVHHYGKVPRRALRGAQ